MIELTHMIFYVTDVPASLHFYEEIFGLKKKFVHEEELYAELETGSVVLAFASYDLADLNLPQGYIRNQPGLPPQSCELCFRTENLEQTLKYALKKGALEVAAPTIKPWGETVAYIRDPEGILIAVSSGMISEP